MNSGDYALVQSNSQLALQPEVELTFADFLINQAVDAAFCLGVNAQFIYVNDATCGMTEYSREELLSMTMHDIDIDFSLHDWSEKWQYLVSRNSRESLTFKSRYRKKSGQIFLVEIAITYVEHQGSGFGCAFVRDKSDEVVELSVQKWIDEFREAKEDLQQEAPRLRRKEERLRLNEAKFRTLAETTNASIFLLQDTQICYVNPAVELLTGYTKGELLADFDLCQLIISKKRQQGEVANSEYLEMNIRTKNGKEVWLACMVVMLDGVIGFGRKPVELIAGIDITNYKYAELELHQALEQAKQLSELRAYFVSMVCHQFRTPLNIVSFSNSLLKRHIDEWTEEKTRPLLDHIQTAVEQLSHMLDDILLLAKAEAAKLNFDPQPLDLGEFCRELLAQMQLSSNHNPIQFVSSGNCLIAWIDKKLLEPILNNLLDNAIKYSPIGSVVDLKLTCEFGKVFFQIKDQGIGIPVADQQRLFEPFYRGSNIAHIPGTGIGLSIVKTLVDLHGGQITVVSEVDVGTTFTVMLPSAKLQPTNS